MAYNITLDVYQGPFDLLLDLISKQKVDIYDVPIARITDEYLAHVSAMQELDLELATEFLLLAAVLLDLKTSALLPKEEPPSIDEELGPEEARENLIARLLEYKKFKSVAVVLGTRYTAESKFYMRDVEPEEEFIQEAPLVLDVDIAVLASLFAELNKPRGSILDADHIAIPPLRVADFAVRIRERLSLLGGQTFRQLTKDCASRSEIIASFLAILELYKQGFVDLGQAELFGDIEVAPMVEEVLVQ
ncbi:MAG: segregation and condensation protein A [Candidatus Aquicultorales bacterium]